MLTFFAVDVQKLLPPTVAHNTAPKQPTAVLHETWLPNDGHFLYFSPKVNADARIAEKDTAENAGAPDEKAALPCHSEHMNKQDTTL